MHILHNTFPRIINKNINRQKNMQKFYDNGIQWIQQLLTYYNIIKLTYFDESLRKEEKNLLDVISNKKWIQEEKILKQIMEQKQFQNRWVLIAQMLNSRTKDIPGIQEKNNKQCRQRWEHKLKISQNQSCDSKNKLTSEMKISILNYVQQGMKWKKISSIEPFTSMSDSHIKNKFNSFMRATLKAMCKATNHSIKVQKIPPLLLSSMGCQDDSDHPLKKHFEFIKEYSNIKAYKKCVKKLVKSISFDDIAKMNEILDDFAFFSAKQKIRKNKTSNSQLQEMEYESQGSDIRLCSENNKKQSKQYEITPSKTMANLDQNSSSYQQHINSLISHLSLHCFQNQNGFCFQNQNKMQRKIQRNFREQKTKNDIDDMLLPYSMDIQLAQP